MTDREEGAGAAVDPVTAPGGHVARARGCRCSVLANAAYRAGAPGEQAFVDPDCTVHRGGPAPCAGSAAGKVA